jgi:hypothetical protein
MRSRMRKRCLVMATVPAAVIMTAVPAGVAFAATQSSTSAGGADQQYIVILHNQNSSLGARSTARRTAVASEQRPVLSQLRSVGGHELGSTSLVNAIVVNATASQAQALAGNSAVAQVVPNQVIPGPALPNIQAPAGGSRTAGSTPFTPALCGTAASPQLNPEALFPINAVQANNSGATGAGVTVATIADGLDPANPDFQRNAAFASTGSPKGSAVVSQVDFSGDAATVPTLGGEMFLDASSIAAQGNAAYDLSQFVSPADPKPLPAGCDIKVVGDAPGANVLALKVFSQNNDTTTSNFLQAINYAVSHGAKVINESFGSNNIPDLAADVVRQADDAAVAAGVTVVASTGDAGVTSTIGSPATDPNVLSVGATTTFRAFEQGNFGGADVPGASGNVVDNNIASISSAGFSEAGNTVDIVAPGDWNWALCSPNVTLFQDCSSFAGTPSGIQFTGGTSESSPLVAGAAADVIQAYAASHHGTDPTPAMVKRILVSSATDIAAPANQQGAGLLNIAAAVKLARSIRAPKPSGGLLLSPGQVNIKQQPGATASRTISVTNTSSHRVTVNLSTRALSKQVASHSGAFCMQPGTPTQACPANDGTMTIWSGATEVFQKETFTVPPAGHPSRLDFAFDYQFSGQTSLMHVALLEPDGTYAGYSDPQGLADFGEIHVANPPAGTWTAVFFTVQDSGTTAIGTSGPIQWNATVRQFAPAGAISPARLVLGAGKSGTATLRVTSSHTAGDTNQSVVVSGGSTHTTIPVTVRTIVHTTALGGHFRGTLTGGNGRLGPQAEADYYTFNVPQGAQNIHADIHLSNDPNDLLTGYLIDPSGQNLGYSTNVTTDPKGNVTSTQSVDLYHAKPVAGQWTIALQWANPVSGLELKEPFTGTIGFGKLPISSNLPTGGKLARGKAHTFTVTIKNSGSAPEAYFVDPRLNATVTLTLPNQNPNQNAASMTLPLPGSIKGGPPFPFYFVPTQTSQISESLTGSARVNFDSSYFPGDPDLEGIRTGHSASLTFSNPEVSPGLWSLNPSEIGPYPSTGAPAVTAAATFKAVTKAFDPAVSSATGDLWPLLEGLSNTLQPVLVPAGGSATITVKITPGGRHGSIHSGVLYVDDLTLAGFGQNIQGIAFGNPNGDEIAAIPYHYTTR